MRYAKIITILVALMTLGACGKDDLAKFADHEALTWFSTFKCPEGTSARFHTGNMVAARQCVRENSNTSHGMFLQGELKKRIVGQYANGAKVGVWVTRLVERDSNSLDHPFWVLVDRIVKQETFDEHGIPKTIEEDYALDSLPCKITTIDATLKRGDDIEIIGKKVRVYYPDHVLKSEINYDRDKPIGVVKTFWSTGELQSEIHYEDGVPNGEAHYFSYGSHVAPATYILNHGTGMMREYVNNRDYLEGHLVNGKKEGTWRIITGTMKCANVMHIEEYSGGQKLSENDISCPAP